MPLSATPGPTDRVLARARLSPPPNGTVLREEKRQAPRPVWEEDVVQKAPSHSSPDAHKPPTTTSYSCFSWECLGRLRAHRHRMTAGSPSSREGP